MQREFERPVNNKFKNCNILIPPKQRPLLFYNFLRKHVFSDLFGTIINSREIDYDEQISTVCYKINVTLKNENNLIEILKVNGVVGQGL